MHCTLVMGEPDRNFQVGCELQRATMSSMLRKFRTGPYRVSMRTWEQHAHLLFAFVGDRI